MPELHLKIGKQSVTVIDLTLPARLDQEVYPGDPMVERSIHSSLEESGFEHYVHQVGDHAFIPHADAPNHQNGDRKDQGVEIFGLDYEFNEAMLIDLESESEAIEVDSVRMLRAVEVKHLEPHREALGEVSAVIVRTGAEQWRLQNRPFKPEAIPFFSREAARYLAALPNMKVVGTDSCTVDQVRPGAPVHSAHQALKDKLIIESLVHLSEIPKSRRRRFLLQTALVKIQGATGCPVMARAFLTA